MDDAILIAEERKPVRWSEHDYSSAGAYFITIAVKNREPVFGSIVEGQMEWSVAGEIAHNCLNEIPVHYPNTAVDVHVVMPDHVHAVLVVNPVSSDRTLSEKRPFETIPLVVGSYKSSVSRLVRAAGNPSFQWQKSYHDRIVRDWMEHDRIRAYIADNPRRWWETHGGQP